VSQQKRDHAILIGDTVQDMVAGIKTRIHSIGVASGYHPKSALIRAGAALVANTLTDVQSYMRAA
jgi:phosphoglycolate phosphatase-like HAD superfamily hydrolase